MHVCISYSYICITCCLNKLEYTVWRVVILCYIIAFVHMRLPMLCIYTVHMYVAFVHYTPVIIMTLTGRPNTGKSTLVNKLTDSFRVSYSYYHLII